MDRGAAAKAKEGCHNLAEQTVINACVTYLRVDRNEVHGFGAKCTQDEPLTRITLSGTEADALLGETDLRVETGEKRQSDFNGDHEFAEICIDLPGSANAVSGVYAATAIEFRQTTSQPLDRACSRPQAGVHNIVIFDSTT